MGNIETFDGMWRTGKIKRFAQPFQCPPFPGLILGPRTGESAVFLDRLRQGVRQIANSAARSIHRFRPFLHLLTQFSQPTLGPPFQESQASSTRLAYSSCVVSLCPAKSPPGHHRKVAISPPHIFSGFASCSRIPNFFRISDRVDRSIPAWAKGP